MRLVAYTRVSTDRQDYGQDMQEAEIRRWAEAEGHVIVAVEGDRISGRTTSRPGFDRALEEIRARRADGVVVHKLDRLSRRGVAGALEMITRVADAGGRVVAIDAPFDTTSAVGELLTAVLAGAARLFVEQSRERTRAAVAMARANGKRCGGYPNRARERVRIADYMRPGMDQRELAARLTSIGVPTPIDQDRIARGLPPTGRVWSQSLVSRELRRQR